MFLGNSLEKALALSDACALEHLEVQTVDWRYYIDNHTHYGSLFCGEETTLAYGDLTVDTNHVLPAMSAARNSSGLTVVKVVATVI